MAKVCPKCKESLFYPDMEYCYCCGTKLEETEELKCECGKYRYKSAKFCPYCGKEYEEACKKCGTKMIRPKGFEKSACPKCNFDLGGGGA